MASFIHVDENNFEKEVLKSTAAVVLEFGAVWCRPCQQLEPVLAKLGQEWGSRVRLAKVDVDESVNLAIQFQVMGVPTVILFSNGQPAARFTGFQSRERILDKLGGLIK